MGLSRVDLLIVGAMAGVGCLGLAPTLLSAQSDAPVVFTADVAPIIQENCVKCHQPEGIGPMPLRSYEEVKPYAPLIRMRVMKGEMPPWPLDKTIGIQDFKNDISLTDDEIQTIVQWIDSGAPMGDPADMPPPVERRLGEYWEFEKAMGGPPDLVIASPAYTVTANGRDHWPVLDKMVEEMGLTEKRWIRAAELRPGSPETFKVFHHANVSMIQGRDRVGVAPSAVGTTGYIYPEDAGQPIKPGEANFSFNMHLYPQEEDVVAVLELGLWLHPADDPPPFETRGEVVHEASQSTGFGFDVNAGLTSKAIGGVRGSGGGGGAGRGKGVSSDPQFPRQVDLLISPNSIAMYRGVYVMDRPARIHSLRGHMHLRGKYQIIEAVYPDGRWEVMNKLIWNQGQQTAFLYEDYAMPLLPKGTVLMITNVFDNTASNPNNPAPNQWVTRGERTVDEMSHARIGMTYFDKEEDFERLVREREQILAERGHRVSSLENR